MKQYRKKPVIIEAIQFDGSNPAEIKDFVGENCEVEIYDNEVTPPVARIVIHTLEGDMEVSKGDYVIKGVKGEFYPCKPDIFQQTYESKEPSKSLEEAAEDFVWRVMEDDYDGPSELSKKLRPTSKISDYYDALAEFFKAGAEWQKEQDNYDTIFYKGMMYYRKRMMEETVEGDYVSFNTAKLLKEKGFDIPLNYFYNSDGRKGYATSYNWNQTAGDFQDYSCPTLQMAMKWLREKKGIAIIPVLSSILDNEKFLWDVKIVVAKTGERYSQGWVYENQEDAFDTAIRYCLENLV